MLGAFFARLAQRVSSIGGWKPEDEDDVERKRRSAARQDRQEEAATKKSEAEADDTRADIWRKNQETIRSNVLGYGSFLVAIGLVVDGLLVHHGNLPAASLSTIVVALINAFIKPTDKTK